MPDASAISSSVASSARPPARASRLGAGRRPGGSLGESGAGSPAIRAVVAAPASRGGSRGVRRRAACRRRRIARRVGRHPRRRRRLARHPRRRRRRRRGVTASRVSAVGSSPRPCRARSPRRRSPASRASTRPQPVAAGLNSTLSQHRPSSTPPACGSKLSARRRPAALGGSASRASRRQRGPSMSSRISSRSSAAIADDGGRSRGSLAVRRAIQVEIARVDLGDLGGGPQRLGDVAQHHRHRRLGVVEGRRAGEQLVRDAADRVEVGPRTDVARHRLLGRHVGRRPDRRAGGGHVGARARLLRRLRDPEVGDLDRAVLGHHQVLGLEVAVHDRALLGRAEAGEHALEHAADLRQAHVRRRTAAATRAPPTPSRCTRCPRARSSRTR